jgi:hypothetical protein
MRELLAFRILCLAFGIVFTICGVLLFPHYLKMKREFVQVAARIINSVNTIPLRRKTRHLINAVQRSTEYYYRGTIRVEVEFQQSDGQTSRATGTEEKVHSFNVSSRNKDIQPNFFSFPAFAAGREIKILYCRNDPTKIVLSTHARNLLVAILFLCTGLGLIFLAVLRGHK